MTLALIKFIVYLSLFIAAVVNYHRSQKEMQEAIQKYRRAIEKN